MNDFQARNRDIGDWVALLCLVVLRCGVERIVQLYTRPVLYFITYPYPPSAELDRIAQDSHHSDFVSMHRFEDVTLPIPEMAIVKRRTLTRLAEFRTMETTPCQSASPSFSLHTLSLLLNSKLAWD